MNFTKKSLRLYAVTDRSWLHGETLYEQVEKALKGGVTLVQLREKELSEADFEQEAKELLELCHKYNVNLIINDNVALAAKVGADGVHIGQSDMGVEKARAILGKDHRCDGKDGGAGKGSGSGRGRLSWQRSRVWNQHQKRCKTDGSCTFTGDLREREDPGGGNRRH